MKFVKFLLISLFGVLCSCTKSPPLKSTRWSGHDQRPQVNIADENRRDSQNLMVGDEKIQFTGQSIAGFRVENSFLKTIFNRSNDVVFESSLLAKSASPLLIYQARSLDKDKSNQWDDFIKKNEDFKRFHLITQGEVVFIANPNLMSVLEYFIQKPSGEIFKIQFDNKKQLITYEPTGSQFSELVESPTLVFPKGPKKSDLTSVTVLRKIQTEGLHSPFLQVDSLSQTKILNSANLEFQPPDDRFDEIQAFYFANKMMDWLNLKLKLQNTISLNITTHLGYPDKTNAAFYFQGRIRLGRGDDITYSNIPWDPTIVMHETAHAAIDTVARLPFQGEGGSLNEGFADFFTTFFLENPLLGENSYRKGPYKRNVDLIFKKSETNGGLYHDSALVSSFFWALRKSIGPDQTLKLGISILSRLGPSSDFNEFILCLQEQSKEILTADEFKRAIDVMKERELL